MWLFHWSWTREGFSKHWSNGNKSERKISIHFYYLRLLLTEASYTKLKENDKLEKIFPTILNKYLRVLIQKELLQINKTFYHRISYFLLVFSVKLVLRPAPFQTLVLENLPNWPSCSSLSFLNHLSHCHQSYLSNRQLTSSKFQMAPYHLHKKGKPL